MRCFGRAKKVLLLSKSVLRDAVSRCRTSNSQEFDSFKRGVRRDFEHRSAWRPPSTEHRAPHHTASQPKRDKTHSRTAAHLLLSLHRKPFVISTKKLILTDLVWGGTGVVAGLVHGFHG